MDQRLADAIDWLSRNRGQIVTEPRPVFGVISGGPFDTERGRAHRMISARTTQELIRLAKEVIRQFLLRVTPRGDPAPVSVCVRIPVPRSPGRVYAYSGRINNRGRVVVWREVQSFGTGLPFIASDAIRRRATVSRERMAERIKELGAARRAK